MSLRLRCIVKLLGNRLRVSLLGVLDCLLTCEHSCALLTHVCVVFDIRRNQGLGDVVHSHAVVEHYTPLGVVKVHYLCSVHILLLRIRFLGLDMGSHTR